MIGLSSLSLTSCDEQTKEILNDITQGNEDEENSNGLKEALRVGVDTAVSRLNVTDGYFRDAAIKLLLPQAINDKVTSLRNKEKSILGGLVTLKGEDLYQGKTIKNPLTGATLLQVNGLKSKEDDLILGLNRAAEDAAGKAKPIFVSAITGMTLTDVSNILFGADTAATSFLKTNTYSNLETEFQPKIDSSLQSVKVSGKSVTKMYEEYATEYNTIVNQSIAGSTVGSLLGITAVKEPNLASYSTKKGLDGLFLKVGDAEKDIRTNPLARVTDLLRKVFSKKQ